MASRALVPAPSIFVGRGGRAALCVLALAVAVVARMAVRLGGRGGIASGGPKSAHNASDKCPRHVRDAVGIYNATTAPSRNASRDADGLENVLLLVSSNFGYRRFLLNWEGLARNLGLKYAIVAMDDELFSYLRGNAVKADALMSPSASEFQEPDFNKISCNKMRVVLDVMERCDVSVVFSDVDNIFFDDPFQHDLGRLIKMRAYDYVYQINRYHAPRRSHPCLTGSIPWHANTGFYYLSKHAAELREITEKTLEICADPSNELDDQTLFWQEVHSKSNDVKSWRHCTAENGYDHPPEFNNSKDAVQLCCLDPYYYPVGSPEYEPKTDSVTFHANWVMGPSNKIDKLWDAHPDHSGWDNDRINKVMLSYGRFPRNKKKYPDCREE